MAAGLTMLILGKIFIVTTSSGYCRTFYKVSYLSANKQANKIVYQLEVFKNNLIARHVYFIEFLLVVTSLSSHVTAMDILGNVTSKYDKRLRPSTMGNLH